MSPILTDEQRQAVLAGAGPVRVVDPKTGDAYVLLRAEQYGELVTRRAEDDFDIREAYPVMDEVARREGWDDPEMACYDEPEPEQAP